MWTVIVLYNSKNEPSQSQSFQFQFQHNNKVHNCTSGIERVKPWTQYKIIGGLLHLGSYTTGSLLYTIHLYNMQT